MFVQAAEIGRNPEKFQFNFGLHNKALDFKSLDKHQILFSEGDKADSFYEILDGIVCGYKILIDGRRQIVSFNFPGDIIGLSSDEIYSINAEALKPSKVRRIRKRDLSSALREDPSLGVRLLKITAKKLAHLQNQNVSIGRKTALERVASFLLVFAKEKKSETSEKIKLALPISRAEIGDHLGLSIETVSRAFTKLKDHEVIDLPQSNLVIVNDIMLLEELSECDDSCK